jgi:hypothetical protein
MCVLIDNLEWHEMLANTEQSYLYERILVSNANAALTLVQGLKPEWQAPPAAGTSPHTGCC